MRPYDVPSDLLDNAELSVPLTVGLEPGHGERDGLADRLGILDRVIELLRVRYGRIENALSMDDMLRRGPVIEPTAYNNNTPQAA